LLYKLHSQVESVMLGVGMAVLLLEIIHKVRTHTAGGFCCGRAATLHCRVVRVQECYIDKAFKSSCFC